MLTAGQLDTEALARRLNRGLTLTTGPFRFRIQSPLRAVHRGLGLLYAGFPVQPDDGFRDFHVSVERSAARGAGCGRR